MIQTIRNAWRVPELKKKMLFTIMALLIFRLGSAIPVPYIDGQALQQYMNSQTGILGLMNAMSGSAFSMATVFALSIQPYINSSIIIQLLTVAIPALERLQKEGGEEGRKKIASITRYTTVAIALLQGFGYYTLVNSYGLVNGGSLPGFWVGLVIVLSFTAGSAFLMWLGEQITEFGIGNGISIILFAGIVSRFPQMIMDCVTGLQVWNNVRTGAVSEKTFTDLGMSAEQAQEQVAAYAKQGLAPWIIALIVVGMLALVVFIVYINNAERRIPVQYAKRVVGRKMYGGQSSFMPIKVNMSGVLPVIFASTFLAIPGTIGGFLNLNPVEHPKLTFFFSMFSYNSVLYAVLYFLLIIGFNYFYIAIQYNPIEMANNLRKNNGAIPGIRPGKPTSDFITKVISKITLVGALMLGAIAILPILITAMTGMNVALGGTSVIIVVGVALDTVRSLESQMMMRHYKGFLE